MNLSLTENAIAKVRNLLEKEQKPGHGLRLAVIGGGCSGFQYDLQLDDETDENDNVLEFDGVRVFVDAKSALFLEGSTVDFVDSLKGSGFAIENPNALSACGCGQSIQF